MSRFLFKHWQVVLSAILLGGAGLAVAYDEVSGGSLGVSGGSGQGNVRHAALASVAAMVVVLVARSRRAAKNGPRP